MHKRQELENIQMVKRRTPAKVKGAAENNGPGDECFTIMPFGGWFDRYYTDIYCPAIEKAGLVPRRADDLYRPSAIVHDIWRLTRNCRIVLADLTGKNPNVFYELGLAHAIAKPAILVTESIGDVPFDLRALRVIEYDKNAPMWGEILQGKIEIAIREVVAAPLQSVLPSFLEVENTQRPPVTESEKDLLEIRQELELLRREIRRSADLTRGDSNFPLELASKVREFIENGIPPSVVRTYFVDRGVPATFIEYEIDRFRRSVHSAARASESPSVAGPDAPPSVP